MPRAVDKGFDGLLRRLQRDLSRHPSQQTRKETTRICRAFSRDIFFSLSIFRLDFLRQNNIATKDIEAAFVQAEEVASKAEAALARKLSEETVITTTWRAHLRDYGQDNSTPFSLPDDFKIDDLVISNNDQQAFHLWFSLYQTRKSQYELYRLVEQKYKGLAQSLQAKKKELEKNAPLNYKDLTALERTIRQAKNILYLIGKERAALSEKLFPPAKKVARLTRAIKDKNDLSAQLLIDEIDLLCHELALDAMPHQFNGVCAKIKDQITEIKRGLKLLRGAPWLPAKAAASLSTALLCLVLHQGISQEPESGPPPEDDPPVQIDNSPESRAAKNQPAALSAADRIRSLARKSLQAKQAKVISRADQVRQAAVGQKRGHASNKGSNVPPLPPTPREDPAQAVAAFEKALSEGNLDQAETEALFRSKLEPLLNDELTPASIKQRISELQKSYAQRQAAALPGTHGKGYMSGESSRPGAVQRRQDRVVEDVGSISFGEVIKVHNYPSYDGYLEAQVLDVINGDDLGQSTNPPTEPVGRLIQDSYVEVELLHQGQSVSLRKTVDGRVDHASIVVKNADGTVVPPAEHTVSRDVFNFTHINFGKTGRRTIRFRIHRQESSPLQETSAFLQHYTQVRLTEPLNLPTGLSREIERLQNGSFSRREIVTALSSFLADPENFPYDSDPATERQIRDGSGSMINNFFALGRGDCEDKNLALVIILRQYFRIPAVIAQGNLHVLETDGHQWVKVVLDGSWEVADGTGSATPTGEGQSLETSLASMPATPANSYYLLDQRSAANGARRTSIFNSRGERQAADRALFRIAQTMGQNYINLAIDTAFRDASHFTRIDFTQPNALARVLHKMNEPYRYYTSPNEHFDARFFFFDLFLTPEGRSGLQARAQNIILRPDTPSSARAAYMIAFHVFESVDAFYAQGLLVYEDYLAIRLAQAYIQNRPLLDLASQEQTQEYIYNNIHGIFIKYWLDQRLPPRELSQRCYVDLLFEFIYQALVSAGRLDAYWQNTRASNALESAFWGYIAYRTQNQNRKREMATYYSSYIPREFTSRIINGANSPWPLYALSNRNIVEGLFLTSSGQLSVHSLANALSRLEREQRQEIFESHLDFLYPYFENNSLAPGQDSSFHTLRALLLLTQIDRPGSTRFLSLARQIAPQALAAVQQQDSFGFHDLDLSIIPDLMYLDEDGIGVRILTEILSRMEFANSDELEAVIRARNNASDARPNNFTPTREARLAYLQFMPVFDMIWFNHHLAENESPEAIAAAFNIDSSNLNASLEVAPALIHSLLLSQLVAEVNGVDVSTQTTTTINDAFARGDFSGDTFLPDLLYPDLLSELPPNTQALYLETLDRALQGATLTEEDFRQIGSIILRNPDNPLALRLMSHLARNQQIDFEMPSFARFTTNFLSNTSSLPANEQALIASFLLTEGVESVATQDQLLALVEQNSAATSGEDRVMLTRNLSRFRNEATRHERLLRQIELDRPGRNAREISTLGNMIERLEALGLGLGEDY